MAPDVLPRGRGLVSAAAAWVPVVALVVIHTEWRSAPARLPTHFEAGGRADGFTPSLQVFLGCLAGAVGVALLALAIVLFLQDLPLRSGAIALGAACAVATIVSLVWTVFALTAAGPGAERIGLPFLLFFAGIGWGAIAWLLAGPFPRHATVRLGGAVGDPPSASRERPPHPGKD